MHLIVTGASGLVGSIVLDCMINDPNVTRVSVLSRGPVPQAQGHSKVQVIIERDLFHLSRTTMEALAGAKGCVWCIGPSVVAVSKEDFVSATKDLPVAAATQFATLHENFVFVYISHDGIDHLKQSRRPLVYRIKGEAEDALFELGKTTSSLKPYSVRPAAIDYFTHAAVLPYVKKPLPLPKKFSKLVFPVIRKWAPHLIVKSQDLGNLLDRLAMGDGTDLTGTGVSHEGRVLTNQGIQRMCYPGKPYSSKWIEKSQRKQSVEAINNEKARIQQQHRAIHAT